jgi:hypothetical protein
MEGMRRGIADCCVCGNPIRCVEDLAFFISETAAYNCHADCGLYVVFMAMLLENVANIQVN